MRTANLLTGLVLVLSLLGRVAGASDEGPVTWWRFEADRGEVAFDPVGGVRDEIRGTFRFVEGASGAGLKFDGFTTNVVRKAADAPRLGEAFTIEAWVALAAYPLELVPDCQSGDGSKGRPPQDAAGHAASPVSNGTRHRAVWSLLHQAGVLSGVGCPLEDGGTVGYRGAI